MADFEKNIEELEQIVNKLNGGELPLKDSIALYEKGMKLAKQMEKQLDATEKKINIIVNGEEEPFDNSEQEAKQKQMDGSDDGGYIPMFIQSLNTRYRYRNAIYTYYYYRDVDEESETNPSEQDNVSNVQEWVKYTN